MEVPVDVDGCPCSSLNCNHSKCPDGRTELQRIREGEQRTSVDVALILAPLTAGTSSGALRSQGAHSRPGLICNAAARARFARQHGMAATASGVPLPAMYEHVWWTAVPRSFMHGAPASAPTALLEIDLQACSCSHVLTWLTACIALALRTSYHEQADH